MLKIQNYTKVYDNGKVGAKKVNLHVEKGDVFAFIGHNGAGKTTTLKSVVGILDITEGEIFVDGINVKENPLEAKKKIAFVPDNPDLYDSLTGVQYVNFIADVFDVDEKTRKELCEKYAKELEIFDVLNNPISTYSHGMRQKLALVSALVHSPKLMILDEPFVGLDPKAAFSLKKIMKDFVASGGAIFFSTHVLEVAEKLCNKVAIIKNGEIVAVGKMSEIKKDKSLENVFLEIADAKS